MYVRNLYIFKLVTCAFHLTSPKGGQPFVWALTCRRWVSDCLGFTAVRKSRLTYEQVHQPLGQMIFAKCGQAFLRTVLSV